MNLIIPSANAEAATGAFGGFDFMSILPLVLIFAVFYFFLIRPQQKKAQQQKDLLSSLRRGDRIVTTGGLIGIITKVINDQEIQIEIAEGVRVRVARAMVATILSKTEPVAESIDELDTEETAPNLKKPGRTKKTSK